jgi:SAM-dependent methyltransferase
VLANIKRYGRDSIVRLGMADAAFWLYGQVSKMSPSSVMSNRNYRRLGAPDHLPIPPADLIFLVAGSSSIAWFLTAGGRAATSITDALGNRGVRVAELSSILDFGCGCGRVLRHWKSLPTTRVCGVDYNAALIEWCRTNLPFAEAQTNQLAPPLSYRDGEFDLVYALSVFTHLTHELQTAWIGELSRVVRPGGHLVISTHGNAYLDRLNEDEKRRYMSGQLVVKNNLNAPGSNMCSAYHPLAYIRDQMAPGLEVVDLIPEGATGNPRQDLIVLRKPRQAAYQSDAIQT